MCAGSLRWGCGCRVGQTHGHTAWCRVVEAVVMETKVVERAFVCAYVWTSFRHHLMNVLVQREEVV